MHSKRETEASGIKISDTLRPAKATEVGACLAHIMPDGEERPIAFASRTLSTAEKKYAQLKKRH